MSETTKKQVGIKNIQAMLKQGMTRKQIAAHYDLPLSYMQTNIFNHPDLKGLKTAKSYNVELVEEEIIAENEATANVVEGVEQSAPAMAYASTQEEEEEEEEE